MDLNKPCCDPHGRFCNRADHYEFIAFHRDNPSIEKCVDGLNSLDTVDIENCDVHIQRESNNTYSIDVSFAGMPIAAIAITADRATIHCFGRAEIESFESQYIRPSR